MRTAKCGRCGGRATGESFEEASAKINHASGLSKSKPCGADYNCVIEIDKPIETIQEKKIKEPTPIVESIVESTIEKISEPTLKKKIKASKTKIKASKTKIKKISEPAKE